MALSAAFEIKLSQQTPMIHFQHAEDGACIRASEFKPKFDTFLIRYHSSEIDQAWYRKDTDSFDYKLKITVNGPVLRSDYRKNKYEIRRINNSSLSIDEKNRQKGEINKSYPGINAMYFGNMGENTVKKETVFYEKGITLHFFCLNEKLSRFLKKYLDSFLAVTNFGTRQSKGFGGFIRMGNTEEESKQIVNDYANLIRKYGRPFFYFKSGRFYTKQLNDAQIVYAAMKSGIPRRPVKGFLVNRIFLNEALSRNTGSDKDMLSHKLFDKREFSDYKFTRILLGLADNIPYRDGPTIVIKDENGSIQRYRSAITVKMIGNYVYFILEDTFNQIQGSKFTFYKKTGAGDTDQELDKIGTISVPEAFDDKKFIAAFVSFFNDSNFKTNIKLTGGNTQ